jgi:hypothetical protein
MTDSEDRPAPEGRPATDEGQMPDLERRAIIGKLAGMAAGTALLVTVLLEERSEAS